MSQCLGQLGGEVSQTCPSLGVALVRGTAAALGCDRSTLSSTGDKQACQGPVTLSIPVTIPTNLFTKRKRLFCS
jgi:hypothetical protein